MTDPSDNRTCAISGKTVAASDCIPCASLRPSLLAFIRKKHPELSDDECISRDILPELKAAFVEEALSEEIGEITDLERNVIESIREHEVISEHPDDTEELSTRSFGDRLADRIASFGGSWKFIIIFATFIFGWILLNVVILTTKQPDPYPFILLNLLLSCLAAFQAPVIMMSQNRGEARDRKRAEQDYQINLKAELEIRHLHEKLDHLLHHHGERLLEIQTIQTELLRQLVDRGKEKEGASSPPGEDAGR
ncbi:DUF1003 domain-containing protein [Luteolibacter flavescens]|uniref:DUF1003 domain-containing protein n=1 Tax=Luteolibacter flavescens TaxID=1859460 RepID=A0ABT3FL74_9BACT|nr:DUF1003 domain-containing protein [Luteolibacter flavescens]MCW1884336.1 DUF1003 domain-containing protein [Luteolibacter flavescens]